LNVDGRPPFVVDPANPKPFVLKESCSYRLVVQFAVQREPVLALKLLNIVTRMGVRVDKDSYVVGSYPPKADSYTFACEEETAPSGILARGSYEAIARFLDDDGTIHCEIKYGFDIKKDWGS